MRRDCIDQSWEFMFGEPSNIPGMPKETREVNLPHDFMIETDVKSDSVNGANTGYYDGSTATYTKYIDAPKEWENKRVLVEFDGAFRDVTVNLNGSIMGRHHYGYTPFIIDLTSRMKLGKKNRLAVTVSNDMEPNSRWYPGAGIYRHVHLLTAPKLHIAPHGIFVYTDHIVGEDVFVIAEITMENHTAEDQNVWINLLLAQVSDNEAQLKKNAGTVKVHVPAGGTAVARTQFMVEQAKIWDIDSPNLYQVTAQLMEYRPAKDEIPDDSKVLDCEQTNFGIRTISVDAKNGFMLNGRTVHLKGGCVHHDNGILGAASFRDSEYRKVKLHKDNGYNALRFAHNPVSTDMLDACDRLGIVVINEAFDTWNMSKNTHDYCGHFAREWKAELTSFVVRDRNHPSVIFWSIGNELPEQGGLSDGYQTSAMLSEQVRKLDHTRFVTGALCSFFNGLDDEDRAKFWQSLMQEAQLNGGALNNLDGKFGREIWNDYTEGFVAPWDVVGYNYLNYHYEEALELFPNRVICCTESKPRQMEEYWEDVLRLPNVIGDFEWTSHDYIGEAGIGKRMYVEPEQAATAGQVMHMAGYPWRTAGAGEFDLCGFEKPQLAYRRIIWGSDETYIACHNPQNYGKVELLDRYAWQDCANSWSWPVEEGSPIRVEVYSAAEEVELILNGKSVGKEKAGKDNHRKVCFELKYEPGVLEAISYTNGQEVSRDRVVSAGKPEGLRITTDTRALHHESLSADGQSLAFAIVEVVDEKGNPVPYVETEVTAQVEGEAVLAAFGTGRTITEENYTSGKVITYQGKALAIIRAGQSEGVAKLTVKAEGLGERQLELPVKNEV